MVEVARILQETREMPATNALTTCWEHPARLLDRRTVPKTAQDLMAIILYSLDNLEAQPDAFSPELQTVRKVYSERCSEFSPLFHIRQHHTAFTAEDLAIQAQKYDLLPKITSQNRLTERTVESWLLVATFASLGRVQKEREELIKQWNSLVATFPAQERDIFTINDETQQTFRNFLITLENPPVTSYN